MRKGGLPSFEDLSGLLEIAEETQRQRERYRNKLMVDVILLAGSLIVALVSFFEWLVVTMHGRAFEPLNAVWIPISLICVYMVSRTWTHSQRYRGEHGAYREVSNMVREIYSLLVGRSLSPLQEAQAEVRLSRLPLASRSERAHVRRMSADAALDPSVNHLRSSVALETHLQKAIVEWLGARYVRLDAKAGDNYADVLIDSADPAVVIELKIVKGMESAESSAKVAIQNLLNFIGDVHYREKSFRLGVLIVISGENMAARDLSIGVGAKDVTSTSTRAIRSIVEREFLPIVDAEKILSIEVAVIYASEFLKMGGPELLGVLGIRDLAQTTSVQPSASDSPSELLLEGMNSADAGKYDDARRALTAALNALRESGDAAGWAAVSRQLGILARQQGDYDEARQAYIASLSIWESLDDEEQMASTLRLLGDLASSTKAFNEAVQAFSRAFSLHYRLDNEAALEDAVYLRKLRALMGSKEFELALSEGDDSREVARLLRLTTL